MTDVEQVAKEELGVELGQVLYVVSDYDGSVLEANVVSITKPYNKKYFELRIHDYIIIYTVYKGDKTGGTVCFHPRDFGKYIFLNREDAEKVAEEWEG